MKPRRPRLPRVRSPSASRPRTPEQQAAVAAALASPARWYAWGPGVGAKGCGHRHLSPSGAARCLVGDLFTEVRQWVDE